MPTSEQIDAIQNNRLGLRVVDDGTPIISGSCYYLFPVNNEWDELFKATCATIVKTSAPNKRLHMLSELNEVKSAQFTNADKSKTFYYGRVTGKPKSLASVNLYGNES